MTEGRLSNKEFSEQDKVFRMACELASLPPSVRQASKFRRGKGLAFPRKIKAILMLKRVRR